jgi:hypothetical protein
MAFDWTLPRSGPLRFVRVAYETRVELEPLTTVQAGGSISRQLETGLKESGYLQIVNPPAIADDLVRVYYEPTDSAGESTSVALATMHAAKGSTRYTSAAQPASWTLYSALLTLEQTVLQESLTIAAGAVAVTEASDLCTDIGLPVVITPSTKQLTVDHGWNAGDSYMKVINELLDFAGYWSARPDGWGRVVMAPYVEPGNRAAVWTFEPGANCTFIGDVTYESDAFDVPNVCVLTCSNGDTSFSGSYTNDDPSSPYSTVTRGREIALPETVTDAVDGADLALRAQKRLMTATAATETITVRHAYVPVKIGDLVQFSWPKHSIAVRASVQSQDIALGRACLTASTLKRLWVPYGTSVS